MTTSETDSTRDFSIKSALASATRRSSACIPSARRTNPAAMSSRWPARPAASPSSGNGTRRATVCSFRTPPTPFSSRPIPARQTWQASNLPSPITATARATVSFFESAIPITLLHPQAPGGALQIQFQSQPGFTHAVQCRTSLAAGTNWQTCTNVTGDGALKTILIPAATFLSARQGFVRILTQ